VVLHLSLGARGGPSQIKDKTCAKAEIFLYRDT
jgi:hypothetical protein